MYAWSVCILCLRSVPALAQIQYVSLCAHVYAGEASDQLVLPSSATNATTCDFSQLDARVGALNKVCCFNIPGQSASGHCNSTHGACTVDCAVVLLPLVKDCRPVLDLLYDPLDHSRDGHAGVFDAAHRACLTMPGSVALDELTRLRKSNPGICTSEILNTVAQTQVTYDCADTNSHCKGGIESGFTACPAGGQCDKTCNLCPDTGQGGRHRLLDTLAEEVHVRRRTQAALPCNLQSFNADIRKLNSDCCDDGGRCSTGVPTSCDAKCAVTFVEWYDRCQKVMLTRFSTKLLAGFASLYTTCTKKLPIEALIEAVAKCRGFSTWEVHASAHV